MGWRDQLGQQEALEPIVRHWILQLLVHANCQQVLVRRRGFQSDELATALGLGRHVDALEFDREAVLAEIKGLYERSAIRASKARVPGILAKNIKRVSKMLCLAQVEEQLLAFAVMLHSSEHLDEACDLLGHSLTAKKAIRVLSRLLELPFQQVGRALHPSGILARSGILSIDLGASGSLRGKLSLLSPAFADLMTSMPCKPVELLRGTVAKAPAPELSLGDYGHLGLSLELLLSYMQRAVAEGRPGVNIFLHGPPGTGKTQLARVLASKLRCDLLEVSCEDDCGDSVDGERRLRAFRAAQALLAQGRSLILFDEVEDVFNDGNQLFGRKSTAQSRKAWMNRMLEEVPVPTFWLSNSVSGVDPAFMRRFDMVIEVPIPPRSQRQRIVQRACGGLVSAACIERIAESDRLAPAVVARASSVVRSLGASSRTDEAERALEHLLGNTLEAQGHRRLVRDDPNRLPGSYDLAFLNPDADIRAIAEGLKASRSGRLCLYGPPGTGKTAFGRWLAQELDMPLQVKRASDIISPWLGMTEQNLARAFREAEQEGALLLIDEVDSFLRDRAQAQRSWEVTGVNEMLTQMEAFPGVFIASTNLMEGLDKAALRRFDVKIRMDYLTPRQNVAMLQASSKDLGIAGPTSEEEASARALSQLTPGDFAALMRQNRFRPIRDAGQLVELLKGEAALKGASRRPIGFVH